MAASELRWLPLLRSAGINSTRPTSVLRLAPPPKQLAKRVDALTAYLVGRGFTGPDAATAAQARLLGQLQHQMSLLAFMDCFRIIAWVTLATVPLIAFVRHFKGAKTVPAAH